MCRLLVLVALLGLLAVPAAAPAQGNPFGPLPAPEAPTPEPVEVPNPADQAKVSRPLLLGIAGGVALLFIGIGLFIARDARQNLSEADRRTVERERTGRSPDPERRQADRSKKKARAKAKAQRQARKKQRR